MYLLLTIATLTHTRTHTDTHADTEIQNEGASYLNSIIHIMPLWHNVSHKVYILWVNVSSEQCASIFIRWFPVTMVYAILLILSIEIPALPNSGQWIFILEIDHNIIIGWIRLECKNQFGMSNVQLSSKLKITTISGLIYESVSTNRQQPNNRFIPIQCNTKNKHYPQFGKIVFFPLNCSSANRFSVSFHSW